MTLQSICSQSDTWLWDVPRVTRSSRCQARAQRGPLPVCGNLSADTWVSSVSIRRHDSETWVYVPAGAWVLLDTEPDRNIMKFKFFLTIIKSTSGCQFHYIYNRSPNSIIEILLCWNFQPIQNDDYYWHKHLQTLNIYKWIFKVFQSRLRLNNYRVSQKKWSFGF